VKQSWHVSVFDLSLRADNRNAADGLFTKPSRLSSLDQLYEPTLISQGRQVSQVIDVASRYFS
jgi:hypothetical protein